MLVQLQQLQFVPCEVVLVNSSSAPEALFPASFAQEVLVLLSGGGEVGVEMVVFSLSEVVFVA